MFEYPKFDVTVSRNIDKGLMYWPVPEEVCDEKEPGGNHEYWDLRNLSLSEAKRLFDNETELIARIESAEDPDEEYALILDELWENPDDLMSLELGVASTVGAISTTGCIPISSCNGGVFGDSHGADCPLVAFYARSSDVDTLLELARSLGNKSQKSTFLKIFSTLFCYFLENVLLIPTIAIKVAKKLDVISTGLMDLDLFPRLLVANLSSC